MTWLILAVAVVVMLCLIAVYGLRWQVKLKTARSLETVCLPAN